MKKLAVLVLSALLVLTLVVPAVAEDPLPLLQETYTVEDNQIICKGLPIHGNGTITVTADGGDLDAVTCSSYGQEEIGITFVVVTDLSRNLSQVQRSQMNEALQAISDQLGAQDKMILVGMGVELTIGSPMTTKAEWDAAINGTWNYTANTYIDRCILRLMEELTVPGAYNDPMSIIVLSDGLDDIGSPQAEKDAYAAVETSGLTVNTITLLDSSITEYARTRSQAMDQFAELSVNGIHYTPSIDAITAGDAAKQIVDAAHNAPVLCIDGAYLDHSGSNVTVEALCVTNNGTYASAITIHGSDITAIPEPTEATTEPPTEETTQPVTEAATEPVPETTAPKATPKATFNFQLNRVTLLLIGGIAAAVLGVVLLLAAIVAWRRDEAEEDDDVEFMDQDNPPPVKDVSVQLDDIVIPDDDFDTVLDKITQPKADGALGSRITLTVPATNTPVLQFSLDLGQEKTLGRTDRADYVLDGGDSNLSGCHFALKQTERGLSIRDCASTNGTMVGGQMLTAGQWQPIRSGSTIFAGSREYLLTAEPITADAKPEDPSIDDILGDDFNF